MDSSLCHIYEEKRWTPTERFFETHKNVRKKMIIYIPMVSGRKREDKETPAMFVIVYMHVIWIKRLHAICMVTCLISPYINIRSFLLRDGMFWFYLRVNFSSYVWLNFCQTMLRADLLFERSTSFIFFQTSKESLIFFTATFQRRPEKRILLKVGQIYIVRYYLPTPPLGQDMTQGQFLSGV